MMDCSEILVEVRKVIEKEENWTQFTPARDKNNNPVYSLSNKAVKFCVLGAIFYVLKTEYCWTEIIKLLDKTSVTGVAVRDNDTLTHNDVLKMIDKALIGLKKED